VLRLQFPWSAYPSSLACKRWVTHAAVLPICIYVTRMSLIVVRVLERIPTCNIDVVVAGRYLVCRFNWILTLSQYRRFLHAATLDLPVCFVKGRARGGFLIGRDFYTRPGNTSTDQHAGRQAVDVVIVVRVLAAVTIEHRPSSTSVAASTPSLAPPRGSKWGLGACGAESIAESGGDRLPH